MFASSVLGTNVLPGTKQGAGSSEMRKKPSFEVKKLLSCKELNNCKGSVIESERVCVRWHQEGRNGQL